MPVIITLERNIHTGVVFHLSTVLYFCKGGFGSRICSTSRGATADRNSSTMRQKLTTLHEFHLVNPAGHEGIGSDNTDSRCQNTVRSRTARMTRRAATAGKASTSKWVLLNKSFRKLTRCSDIVVEASSSYMMSQS